MYIETNDNIICHKRKYNLRNENVQHNHNRSITIQQFSIMIEPCSINRNIEFIGLGPRLKFNILRLNLRTLKHVNKL